MINNLISKANLKDILEKLKNSKHISVSGVSGSFSGLLASAISFYSEKKVLIITRDELRARELSEDISFFAEKSILHFPEREPVFYDIESAGTDIMHKRLEVMHKVISNNYNIIVANINGLMLKLPSKASFIENTIELKKGKAYSKNELEINLVKNGYIIVDKVNMLGEFSKRGSIIDIFPINAEAPVRIDFFGDEIDSIKTFDSISQRSYENLENCEIIQAMEYSINDDDRNRVINALESSNQDIFAYNLLSYLVLCI